MNQGISNAKVTVKLAYCIHHERAHKHAHWTTVINHFVFSKRRV